MGKKSGRNVAVRSEFDQWLEKMCVEHMTAAALGVWDGNQVSEYYTECRKLHLKQGLNIVLTRDVGYAESGRFDRPTLNNCFNLSVASFSPVSMMPEAHRQELAVRIVRKMFWPHAGRVWVEKPNGKDGFAGDIWHYLLFCNSSWQVQALTDEDRAALEASGLIPFQTIVNQLFATSV